MRVMCVAALGICILLTSCTTNPVTGRRGFVGTVSPEQEMQLGLSSFEQLKREKPINHDPEINAMVQRVGKRLTAVAGPDLPNAQWEFVVFDVDEPNAFCLPGGKVGIYTGILPITKDDAGLATVLGHEIGHATARHGAQRLGQAQALSLGSQVAGAFTVGAQPLTQAAVAAAFGIGGPLAVQLPFSRRQESEADYMGLIYMSRAGYNPQAAVQFWQRFAAFNQQHGGDQGLAFLRTHPLDEKRIADLQKKMPEAERIYQSVAAAGGAAPPAQNPSEQKTTP